MRIFLYTNYGDGCGFVQYFQNEGNEAHLFIKEPSYRGKMFAGICKQYSSAGEWERAITRRDLVVFDSVGAGPIGDRLRKRGVQVVGGQVFADKLELDRVFGLDFCEEYKIPIPKTIPFKSVREGMKFVKSNPAKWVFKPYEPGKQNVSADTYVGQDKDGKDMLAFMEKNISNPHDQTFILQEFIDGVELSTSVWFSRGIPIGPTIHTLEEKTFMSGGFGCNTGCQGSLEYFGRGFNVDKCIKDGIGKAFDGLAKEGYTGLIDLNTMIKDGKMFGLEWTPRFGFSSEYAQFEMFKEPVSSFMLRLAQGTAKDLQCYQDEWGFSIRVSQPPYPSEGGDPAKDQALKTLFKSIRGQEIQDPKVPGVHLVYLDVYKEGGKYFTGGLDGIDLELTCRDKTIDGGAKRVYEAAKKLTLRDKQVRDDVFTHGKEKIEELKSIKFWEGPNV